MLKAIGRFLLWVVVCVVLVAVLSPIFSIVLGYFWNFLAK